LSGADPLNLTGILTAGQRLPALSSNRVLYRDGLPVALRVAGEVRFLVELTEAGRWQAQNALIRRQTPTVAALDLPAV
jgi:ATP-dependent Lhr-like helicase